MKNKIWFVTIIIILSNISCVKYKEGPALSFRSNERRISAIWGINEFIIDGKDSTIFFSRWNDNSMRIDFDAFGDGMNNFMYMLYDNYVSYTHYSYGWKWNDNKTSIICTNYCDIDSVFTLDIFKKDLTIEWKIKKLKYNNLILETEIENKKYRLDLYRKSDG